jgi:hypothetical protein
MISIEKLEKHVEKMLKTVKEKGKKNEKVSRAKPKKASE